MANKAYRDSVGLDIIINMQADISAATAQSLLIKKPDGSFIVWSATVYDTNYLKHTTVAGDINIAGIYKINPKLTFSTQIIYGETVDLIIYEHFD